MKRIGETNWEENWTKAKVESLAAGNVMKSKLKRRQSWICQLSTVEENVELSSDPVDQFGAHLGLQSAPQTFQAPDPNLPQSPVIGLITNVLFFFTSHIRIVLRFCAIYTKNGNESFHSLFKHQCGQFQSFQL